MGPYLAIVRDSFHAALSSRILWVAFVAIWLLLAGLALVGYREDFTANFLSRDLENGTRLKAMLAEGLVLPDAQQSPLGRISRALPEELRRSLRRVGQGDDVRIRYSALADGLNELLDDDQWYDEEIWRGTVRLRELRELDAMDVESLSDSLRRRRARLRIEAALPGVVRTRSARSIVLTYAGFDFPANFQVDQPQFVTLVNQWVVPTIINWLLGFVLVFLGILVTASIIPDMLQPGSLHLLLSKPVSRTMLFLSKFLGGCAFVLLCVIQLVMGLYLIAGLRLDLWNLRILWCIPVSVFLFSVFYSVSALAGLKWRSPILSIGITCMFGALCLIVGMVGGFFDALVTGPDRIAGIASADGTLVASTRGGGLLRFDAGEHRWIEVVGSDPMKGDRILAPIRLDEKHIATAHVRGGRFNPYGSGSLDLLVMSAANDWQPEPSVRLPTGTTHLLAHERKKVFALTTGALMATGHQGVLAAADLSEDEISNEGNVAASPATQSADTSRLAAWISRLTGMQGGATEGFYAVLPQQVTLTPPRGLVIDRQGTRLIALTQGRLLRLKPKQVKPKQVKPKEAANEPTDESPWEIVTTKVLQGEPLPGATLAVSGDVVLVSRPDEPVLFFTADDLELIGSLDPPGSLTVVASLGVGSNGRFAVVTSDGKARLIDTSLVPSFVAQWGKTLPVGAVEILHFDERDQQLLVVHHVDQIDWFEFPAVVATRQLRPSLSRWRLVDRYVVTPLRTITPQTGELGDTIAAMISGKSSVTLAHGSSEDTETRRYEIVRPVASCAGFILVMLTIGCLYFARSDY